jgi:hypothetical protein
MRTTGNQDTFDRRKHFTRAEFFGAYKCPRFGRARSIIRDITG